jgi:X-X-X-Leu-X-X-Gly heptad repeat protein
MSKNGKLLKYKVINTKKDKKLIGEVFDFKKVKAKGGPGGDGGRKPDSTNKITLSKLSDKVDNLTDNLNKLANNLNKLAKIVTDGFASVNHRIDRIVKVNNLKE